MMIRLVRLGLVRGAYDPDVVRLPRKLGWLIALLGYEAAGYGSQLRHLLTQPGVAAALAACARSRRILRPIGRMLGFRVPNPVVNGPAVAKSVPVAACGALVVAPETEICATDDCLVGAVAGLVENSD